MTVMLNKFKLLPLVLIKLSVKSVIQTLPAGHILVCTLVKAYRRSIS